MALITITINSRQYSLACEDGQEERIVNLSKILDEKAKQISSALGHINENLLLAMVGILVADDLSSKNNEPSPNLESIDEELALQINKASETINSIVTTLKI